MNKASAEKHTAADSKHTGQYLTFILAGEEYGIEILKVREIRGWEAPTMLPNTSDYVLGVINLRGTVVPIVDLRRRFGMEHKEFDKTTVVVVVKVRTEDKDRIIGLVVDAVSDVYDVDEDTVRPAPDLGVAIDTEYVRGLATLQDKMIIILDIDHLISSGVLKRIEKNQQG